MWCLVGFTILVFVTVIRESVSKKIEKLPGLSKLPKFDQFSGYAQTSKTHFLHYWIVKAETDSNSKPVLLWMNGGPGCSSMVGNLAEMGPFLVNKDGKTLSANPDSWNKFANIIYLEAPAGVGYSYTTDGNMTTDDDQVSLENYQALKYIYKKFPEFAKLDFYITGQSYGGIYAPTLAKRVIDGQKKFPLKLKGVLIGNGLLDGSINVNTWFKYVKLHGLLTPEYWKRYLTECCNGKCSDDCDFEPRKEEGEDACVSTFWEIYTKLILEQKVNPYDVNADCVLNFHNYIDDYKFDKFYAMLPSRIVPLLQQFLRKKLDQESIRKSFLGSYPCWDDSAIKGYLGQTSVRKALYIPKEAMAWDTCRLWPQGQEYKKIYYFVSRAAVIKEIIKFGAEVFLYYGDADFACSFFQAEEFARKLNLKVIAEKRPWAFKDQNAGYVTAYEGLYMTTVKGAGHMAPADRRPQTTELVRQFITEKKIV